MSVRLPPGDPRRDDELFDRLGRGEPVDGGEVERLLFHWRSAMPSAGPTDERLLDAVTAAVARPSRDRGRWRRAGATVAAALVVTCGGLTAVAAQAGPDSPLWPVTELVFGGIAESRVALERADGALRDARTAVDQGRIPDATRLLAHADHLADKVDEPTAERIREDVAELRERLGPAGRSSKATRNAGVHTSSVAPATSTTDEDEDRRTNTAPDDDDAPNAAQPSDRPSSTGRSKPSKPSYSSPDPSTTPSRGNSGGSGDDDDDDDGDFGGDPDGMTGH